MQPKDLLEGGVCERRRLSISRPGDLVPDKAFDLWAVPDLVDRPR